MYLICLIYMQSYVLDNMFKCTICMYIYKFSLFECICTFMRWVYVNVYVLYELGLFKCICTATF